VVYVFSLGLKIIYFINSFWSN